MTYRHLLGFLPLLWAAHAQGQMNVSTALTPNQLVQDILLGNGVQAFNVTYNGVPSPPGGQAGSGSFTAINTNLGLEAGVILCSGFAQNVAAPASGFQSDWLNTGSDPDLVAISNSAINDKAVLEFDFIPIGDTLRFRYVFGSEEYPEWICSFNDAFGFFLSGPGITGPYSNNAANIALIPGTAIPVTINNVHNGLNNNPNAPGCPAQNPQFYINNGFGGQVVYDGMTVVLTAFALVECGATYHIKLAIGDALDTAFDSGVFLEAGSFTSTGNVIPSLEESFGVMPGNVMLEGCGPYELVFTRLGDLNEELIADLVISGTATPGVDYFPPIPDQLVFPVGEETVSLFLDIPFDGDGPETIIIAITSLIECANIIVETVFTFNIDTAPPINVATNNLNSICGQSHVLAPTVTGGLGQYTFLWSTGETTPTITVSPGVTTTYTVEVGDVCGVLPVQGNFTITLPVYPPLDIEVSPPTEVDCMSTGPISVINASGGDNNFTYQWTLNGLVVGNTATIDVPSSPPTWYVVTVTDGCGTSIQDSVLVSTVPLPDVEVTLNPYQTVICSGDPTTLEVANIIGGNGVYSLAWTNQIGQTIGTTSELTVNVDGSHTYTLTATDQCQNQGSASITVYLPIYDPFVLELTPDQTICAGDDITLHAQVSGGSGYYFIDWHGLNFTDPIMVVEPDQLTEYVVTVTDQCGEQITKRVRIDVEYVFTSIVVTNQGQDDWYLQAATLPFAETWLWDMGDGTRYRGKEVVHSYYDLEDHWVTLWITTPTGCTGVDSVLLRAPAHIYFPNAFTPDGDGINDFFGPIGHYIDEFEMTIFDRWGIEVFNTKDMTIQWDGRVNGSGDPVTGVYVYMYRAKGHYFPAVEGYGHVTLIAGSQY
ncbi:MAG: choice-of-anchor L domain-containing protein [Flavobacteriales bacterium]|nr:choice-of-anchor L domain-containing protein [Flavobacteriales bacterium]